MTSANAPGNVNGGVACTSQVRRGCVYLSGTERMHVPHCMVRVRGCNAVVTVLFLVGFEHLHPNNPSACATKCMFLNDFFLQKNIGVFQWMG